MELDESQHDSRGEPSSCMILGADVKTLSSIFLKFFFLTLSLAIRITQIL
jgi:hypothetical protein